VENAAVAVDVHAVKAAKTDKNEIMHFCANCSWMARHKTSRCAMFSKSSDWYLVYVEAK
jgi:hypothetical protein